MLFSPHLMTQNGVPINVFSFMGTDKSYKGLSMVNMEDVEARRSDFWLGNLLPIEIDVLVHCHAENTSRHSAITEAVYEKWIPSYDVFEKCVASAICVSVWR
ncbi:hypothetical protein TNCV_1521831 [Trichonephila clavipes]|nr:hypothetical protein TNCV_1521831 [Trichonephila clavipes]